MLASASPVASHGAVSIVGPEWRFDWMRNLSKPAQTDHSILVFSAEDFIGPIAVQGGIPAATMLFQVVPLEQGISEHHYGTWMSTLPESLRKSGRFTLEKGVIRGRNGLEQFRIGPLNRSEGWARFRTLVIDAGFFLPLYQDEVRTPLISLVMKLVNSVHRAGVRPDTLWVVNRNRDPEFPLEFGYLPELLRQVFSAPESFKESLPQRWEWLGNAQHYAFFGQVEDAMRLYGHLFREGDPSAYYQAATLKFREGDIPEGIRYLREAVRIDADYTRGFILRAADFRKKGDLESAEKVLRAGLISDSRNEMMLVGLARILCERARRVREENPDHAKEMVAEALSLPIPEEVKSELSRVWNRNRPQAR